MTYDLAVMIQRFLAALGLIAVVATSAFAGNAVGCKSSAQECLDYMTAKLKSSGWVGIEFQDEPTSELGYRITRVIPGSPAEKAGLQEGDILYALNGVKLLTANKDVLAKARKEWKPGQSVTYTIKRAGEAREITLTLAPMPADVMAEWIGQHMRGHDEAEQHTAVK